MGNRCTMCGRHVPAPGQSYEVYSSCTRRNSNSCRIARAAVESSRRGVVLTEYDANELKMYLAAVRAEDEPTYPLPGWVSRVELALADYLCGSSGANCA